MEHTGTSSPSVELLAEIEALAVELAQRAGAQIIATLGSAIAVEYKREDTRGVNAPTNPVSEVDHAVEAMIREAVGARFPDHGIIGEEVEIHPDPSLEFVWVIDPVDGTTNFVNGYPLFASCIGVLQHGLPVAGAIWCATSHQLRAGVYHARRGGPLLFEGEPVPASRPSNGVRRRLLARPGGAPPRLAQWDTRVTGSTAIECAFVSSGIFAAATFWGPFVWDVAAGVVLIEAAGLEVWTLDGTEWRRFERFEAPATVREDRPPTLRDWRRPLAIGTPEGIAPTLRERRNRTWRLRARFRRWVLRFL